MRKIRKKIFIIIIILISFFITTNVYAETDKLMLGSTIDGNYNVVHKEGTHVLQDKMHWIIRQSDNEPVYCVQPFAHINKNATYDVSVSDLASLANITQERWEMISKIAYYGYGYQDELHDHTATKWYPATEMLIWNLANPNVENYFTKTIGGKKDESILKEEMEEIVKLANEHTTLPSFNNIPDNIKMNTPITIDDSANVLYKYQVENVVGGNVIKNGNSLSITATNNDNISFKLTNNANYYGEPVKLYYAVDSQNAVRRGNIDPLQKTFSINVAKGQVKILKYDNNSKSCKPQTNASLIGAKYNIIDSNNNVIDTLTIGNDCSATSSLLPVGNYKIKEESASQGYQLDKTTYDVSIIGNDVVTITSYEEIINAKLKIIKIDNNTNNPIKLSGFKYKIKDLTTNEYLCQNNICEYETNNDGIIITPLPLSYGNYELEEVKAVPNYLLSSEKIKFSIDENSKIINDTLYGTLIEIKVSDKVALGEIEINKIGEKIVIENGLFHYDEIKLDNVSFNLIANEDIILQDGTSLYKKNDIVSSFKTKNGYYKFDNLYLGHYCLIETKTNDSHILNTKPYCFELKYTDQNTAKVHLDITLKNHLKKSNFELTKTDISTSKPIKDAFIEIFTLDDKLIYSGYTDANGKIKVNNLAYGKYKFIESKAPVGYVLNPNVHYFEIKENGKTVKDTLTNEIIKSNFMLTKTDISTGKPVAGATIDIFTLDDKLVFSGVTNNEGIIMVFNLPYGKYKFVESDAPVGYILNPDVHYFEIKEDGKTVKDTLTNEIIKSDFELTKTDLVTGEPVPNALIEIRNSNDDIVFSGLTDENGQIKISNLPYGKYKYYETNAPDGYILRNDIHFFEIKENGEIIKANITNEKIFVPNTSFNDSKIIDIISAISIFAGIGYIIYENKKKK